ncbi:hypothetical protein SOVF_047630 [Spinacia oleracea]|uniref:Zinc finger BED domain-containing protein RICESLEEPER 2 n=1 Tax=Spinacia oleracea TaxID=3562 RepID=A0ABM3RBK1_SPIOL|nr:zinc finger BED domain-containing protein RICESLEEPER 2-like [Spinacia oleracea]KNA20951.1 hypothetical protein SOVF_047630 [Spinacia oleracea]
MSSGGSSCDSIDLVSDIQSPAVVDDAKPSHKEDGVSSMQTSDLYNLPLCERAGRLKTINQLTFFPMGVRRDLAKAIILHDYPLSMVDHMGFRELFNSVYSLVSQNTLKNDISKIHEFNRGISMRLFNETKSRIAITVDKWISCDQTKRYIAITGQIINNDWKVQRRMMRFVNVPCAYTNESVAKLTAECLFDWDVASKISTIAIDYAFDEKLTDILADHLSSSSLILGGKLLRMRCFARTTSLMVKEGFDVIGNVIEKIRESILFWTTTPQRERDFKEASRELSISESDSKLNLDSVSKWNTTFLMLQTALLLKPVFCHLKKQEFEYLCMPSEEEWELAEKVVQKLRLFYRMINCVSKYRSANFFFFDLCYMKITMSKWVICTDEVVRNMASKMLEIFDKYWKAVRDIFAVASVLDQRFKLEGVEGGFEDIYGEGSQKEVEHIRRLCYDLFNEYQSKASLEKTKCDDDSSGGVKDSDKRMSGYEKYIREKRKREKLDEKPELDDYLEKETYSFDKRLGDIAVLDWWRYGSSILNTMVRDILAIPILSVPPEHMFDTEDYRILSPHRSILHPTMVEKLMCTQSWLWTDIKDSYRVTNSYSWGTADDYAVVEHEAAEEAKLAQPH